jgi:hypothetical protein
MNGFEKLFLAVCAIALMPVATLADDSHRTVTYYTVAFDGTNDAVSIDYPSPGATFVQVVKLYSTPAMTEPSVGTLYTSCNSLLSPLDAFCSSTLRYSNGIDSFNIVGYYTELLTPPACPPSTIVNAISGGTGAFQAAQGQVSITHTPINPDDQCNHTQHGYRFKISLLDNLFK